MKFEKALGQLSGFTSNAMKRVGWNDSTPCRFIWVTPVNMVVVSVGVGVSSPLFLDRRDYLADDWVVIKV